LALSWSDLNLAFEKYENFNDYDQPELLTDCHIAKSIIVEIKNADKDVFLHFRNF